ncbi:hypothetical protein [Chengkuizengella axinellae]|uniref:Uncharacterized protein n=1 Tax=Chengkuizengella axinellae TaxID=3064388 RepID=A0ABT9IYG5_9BACL|nr:hypothetical protein [Chengkuizengella sp. 2205SS18-9]MDP5274402.1 hypothetical protein [Chengkuizengella sp. 2205SS18-9]
MKGIKPILSLSLAIGLLIFAIPRLEVGQGWTTPTIFAVVWIGMVLLIIAAHLHEVLGVDEETKKEMRRVKQYQRWKREQLVYGNKRKMMR